MASIHKVYIKLSLRQLGAYSYVDTLALEQCEAAPACGVPVLQRLISLLQPSPTRLLNNL
jgi:hypothetical protein